MSRFIVLEYITSGPRFLFFAERVGVCEPVLLPPPSYNKFVYRFSHISLKVFTFNYHIPEFIKVENNCI